MVKMNRKWAVVTCLMALLIWGNSLVPGSGSGSLSLTVMEAIRGFLHGVGLPYEWAEAGDGASAIDLANRLDIDVILLDLNMKGMSGLDTLNALRRDGVTAQIIILTVSDASSDVFALIDAGADGYLLKDSDPEVLLEAIRAGAKGSKVFSERVNQYLREREMFGAEEDPFSVLTERELDVLHELAQGLSNKQIASVLNISEQTVKVHIRNLLRKLNVRSRVAATILFLQQRGAQ